jgi:hypothetical protein
MIMQCAGHSVLRREVCHRPSLRRIHSNAIADVEERLCNFGRRYLIRFFIREADDAM